MGEMSKNTGNFIASGWTPVAADDPRTLVDPGEYQVICKRITCNENTRWKRIVVTLEFQIVDEGPFFCKMVPRYLHLPLKGAAGRDSNYVHEWTLANQGRAPRRNDRLPFSVFRNKVFRAAIVTVTKDADGRDRLAPYSKVSRLLELAAGGAA